MEVLERVISSCSRDPEGFFRGRFHKMGCACELLVDTDDPHLAEDLFHVAAGEVGRIEDKFSRYKTGNIIHRINSGDGMEVTVDDETANLIDFADRAFHLSGGLFDVTSGILRRVWTFDGRGMVPGRVEVDQCLAYIGWGKVRWRRPRLQLPRGMEIDLGGIGKEYAVDQALRMMTARTTSGLLINCGGDIAVGNHRCGNLPWRVGIEDVNDTDRAARVIHMRQGALATSGDTKKFILADGRRYGHIFDPRTGWPVAAAPRSVTVAAATCTEAGFMSTVGILSGEKAASFLNEAGVRYWLY